VQLPAWLGGRKTETRSTLSVGDPATAAYFGFGQRSYAGVSVNESSALALSAVYRAVSLISGTIGTLPMPTYRQVDPQTREKVGSFLDDPGGTPEIDMTPFEWKQAVLLHLTLHADAFLLHQFNGAGAIVGLLPIHPLAVSVRWKRPDESNRPGRKIYRITMVDDRGAGAIDRDYDVSQLTQITWMSLDGLRGCSPITYGANSLGTAVAGDRAAARMFGAGAMLSGIVSPEEDLEDGDAELIKASIDRTMTGVENAGEIAVVNRRLKFTPWTMSSVDAQFLESRQFSIEEVARWWGVPPHLLMQMDKQTSWGAGVEVQNRAMGRTVLAPWAALIEQRLSRLLTNPRSVEFDFGKLERPTPDTEVKLIIDQIGAGLLTVEEGRQRLGYGPLPAGTPVEPAAPVETPVPEVTP
jgi:HK97 family phage portal protein